MIRLGWRRLHHHHRLSARAARVPISLARIVIEGGSLSKDEPRVGAPALRPCSKHEEPYLSSGLAGLPTTVAPGATSFVTTAPMPTTAPAPIVKGRL